MMRIPRLTTATLLLLPLTVAFIGGDDWKKKFKRNIRSPDSTLRYEAVRQLDPDDSDGLKSILKVLRNTDTKITDWHIRMGAVEALSKVTDEKSLKTLMKELEKGKTFVREAITTAFGRKRDAEHLDALMIALNDDAPAVRRAAIKALAQLKDKRAVDAILERWPEEKPTDNFRQWAICKQSMEELTGKYLGGEPLDWKNWWEIYRERFSFEEEWEDEEKKQADLEKAEKEGRKAREIRSQTRNVGLTLKVRGLGIPILVLPVQGWHEDYFQPYMQCIESFCRVHYVRLPKSSEFKGLERGPGGRIYYPVDKLVDAFEELRKDLEYEKFALMGHGLTSTVAQRYVTKYPKAVSHMILVGAYSGDQAYGRILDKMEAEGKKRGDEEMEHASQNLRILQDGSARYEPKDSDEGEALSRKRFSMRFRNPHDLVVHYMFNTHQLKDGGGGGFFPKFDTFKEGRPPIPTLIMTGKHSLWTSVSDAKKIKKHYPNSTLVVFENSTMMPFVEETERFASVVYKFIKKTK